MKPIRIIFVSAIIFLSVTIWGCDNGRMWEQPSVRPHETPLPVMAKGSVPTQGGLEILRKTDPQDLKNPLPFTLKSVIFGKKKYGMYCAMCHGANADGYGTVGQSFHPLPRDLRNPQVQKKSDGDLFYVISNGQKRMPPLATTVAEEHRWAIINYVRSLSENSKDQK